MCVYVKGVVFTYEHLNINVVGIQPTRQTLTKPRCAQIWINSFYRTRTCLDCCSMFSLLYIYIYIKLRYCRTLHTRSVSGVSMLVKM